MMKRAYNLICSYIDNRYGAIVRNKAAAES